MRLAQRGGNRIFAGIDATSRECDLASVGAKMLAPDGEDQAGLGPVRDGN